MSKLYSGSREDAAIMSDQPKSTIPFSPGMQVESSKVFSIIAHELRSPLGVIQGYVRMLRQQRTPDDPETRMLTAILDATGRISTAAKHASELAAWQDGGPPADAHVSPLSVSTLLRRVAESDVLLRPVELAATPPAADRVVATTHAGSVAAAVAALVVWLQRNRPEEPVRLDARDATLVLAPASAEVPAEVPATAADRARDRVFTGGGQGLALVLARTVLDHHEIGVGLIESPTDVIVLTLPKD
jgi:light-regulated signal transduction histidine kinase (bacteriophytochrome)